MRFQFGFFEFIAHDASPLQDVFTLTGFDRLCLAYIKALKVGVCCTAQSFFFGLLSCFYRAIVC